MLNRLRGLRGHLLGTLWFVPTVIVAGALALAVGMVELSARIDDDALMRWPRVFGAGADSSRSILSAVASGMITVAGLTFSLTMVAVTQASSQYTPRILRNFMGDRPNQVALGTFVGIFAYCLVVLRTIRSVEEEAFVPSLAVVFGIALAIVGIGVLIYSVHHIASSLQASSIVAGIARETVSAIDRLFPDALGDEADPGEARAARARAETTGWLPVLAPATGYIQLLDAEGLLDRAARARRLIRMDRALGDFVVEGTPIASVSAPPLAERADVEADARLSRDVARTFTIGRYRTVEQDAAFGIRQLVDVALKALSPGVNDTTTAVSCVDYLGAILARLAGRRIESPIRVRDGELLVLARGATFEGLLRLAFDEIRQSAGGNVSVLRRLLEVVSGIAPAVRDPGRRELLREQAALVHEVAERTVAAAHDRDRLREAFAEATRACVAAPSLTRPSAASVR